MDGKTRAQRGGVTFPRSHSSGEAELGFESWKSGTDIYVFSITPLSSLSVLACPRTLDIRLCKFIFGPYWFNQGGVLQAYSALHNS